VSGLRSYARTNEPASHREHSEMKPLSRIRKSVALLALLGTAATYLLAAAPCSAVGAPVLEADLSHGPPLFTAGVNGKEEVSISNVGATATSGPVTVDFNLPAGLEATDATDDYEYFFGSPVWSCTVAPDKQSAHCAGPEFFGEPLPIGPGEKNCQLFEILCPPRVFVKSDPGVAPGTILTTTVEVCGGGAVSCVTDSDPVTIVPPGFHVIHFDGSVLKQNGDPATQAGSHPHTASTDFEFSSGFAGGAVPPGTARAMDPVQPPQDAAGELPPGLVGNPRAYPTCTQQQLSGSSGGGDCPVNSQVGVAKLSFGGGFTFFGKPLVIPTKVFNMEVPKGLPALFGFNILTNVTEIYGEVRSGEDYGVTLTSKNIPETLPVIDVNFSFWGVPADPSHDTLRGKCIEPSGEISGNSCPSSAPLRPFVTLPTSCVGPVETFLHATSWDGGADSSSFLSHDNGEPPTPIGADGCNAVPFEPTLEARPTTNVADSASGLDVDLHVPQREECVAGPPVSCETAEANLRDTTVTLPESMVINPSGANGLGACSEAQFGYTVTDSEGTVHTTAEPAKCPDAAKLGTVEIDTPLLEKPLPGAVYLAQPHANPFNSLLALYIAVNDEKTGLVVKLAGEVHADPNTGRLTATFKQNPQLPFEDFHLHFFGGAQGSLRTPAVCGTYQTTSSLTPWTAPEGETKAPSDTWAIQQAPGGGTCPSSPAAEPHSPGFEAGTVSPIAGVYSPFALNLRREDGSQNLSTITVTAPPGFTGRLAGVPYCSNAALTEAAAKSGQREKASPSCPAASAIGSVLTGAGAGPAPYYAKGTAYLAGPYEGAPVSLAVITPAVAGPFDLGTVVVRVALHVNPATGQITGAAHALPEILQGIPLDIRSVHIALDRPQFTRNGTSCDPSSFTGQLTSTLGAIAPLAERFQLGECTGLSFKPKLGIKLIGGTKRGSHPALKATLTMPEGANIAKAAVALPHSEFLDQAHIGTVCTRVQFGANECPAASIYGHATATSPLVDYPLTGNAYLRSSSNKLPDLVIALKGPASQPIEVDASARIDSIKGGIRSTFEGVPDLPVSSFVLEMEGGKKGLLQNSTNICKGIHKATAEFDAHNGKAVDLSPVLKDSKCSKARKGGKGGRAKHRVRAAG